MSPRQIRCYLAIHVHISLRAVGKGVRAVPASCASGPREGVIHDAVVVAGSATWATRSPNRRVTYMRPAPVAVRESALLSFSMASPRPRYHRSEATGRDPGKATA